MKIESIIRIVAGTLVLLSVALGHVVSPWWLLLAVFVAVNLIQSALTGFCPCALMLNKFGAGGDIPRVAPEESARRVEAGTALLIDVREPDEWTDGVAAVALLLPLSDLRGERRVWKAVLETSRDKELILYCRSGGRSGQAAALLAAEGFRTANGGAFKHWSAAGQPVRRP